mgnify:CR=1 FL=1
MNRRIAIAGAGISGLSCAWMLADKGHQVHIFSKSFSPNITSNRAAAFWFPYHIRNDKRGIEWCRTAYNYYSQLSLNKDTGISMKTLIKVLRKNVEEDEKEWIEFMPENSFRIMNETEVDDNIQVAYEIKVPLIETQVFLPWLMQELAAKNAVIEQKEINDLHTFSKDFDVLINCTGLGARALCNDEEIYPVRGQVALIEADEDFNIYLDNEMPLYIVPRRDLMVVGGTYEEHVYEETTEPDVIENLLSNAYSVFPALKNHAVKGSWAGLRPFRKDVRVEHEAGTNIIHNYGHGGSGFTLSFGCAEEVAGLVENIL